MFKNTSLIAISLILAAIALAPINAYLFSFFYIAPFFLFLINNNDLKKLLTGGFIFGFLFLIFTAYVSFEPLIFITSSFLFLGLPASFFIIRAVAGEKTAVISLPILWTFWDFIWAHYSLLPFTMLTAGNALGNSPFVGIASLGGLTALTLFSATVNFLIAMAILKIKNGDRKKTLIFGAAAVLLVLAGYLFSNIELKNNSIQYSQLSGRLNIAAISIDPSFDMEFEVFKNDELTAEEKIKAKDLIQKTIKPLEQDLKNKDLDLVILPEDMIDITITNDTDEEAYQKYQITNAGMLLSAYRKLAKDLNSNILAVMTTVKDNYRRISSVLFDKNGEISGVYDKSTMTIGSEYWPFKKWRPFYYNWLGKIMPDIKDDSPIFDQKYTYQKGTMKVLENNSVPAIGSPICVEIFYPYQIKQFKDMGAKFIVHSSSNVWTVDYGLKSYLEVSDKIRIIESVWLKTPIIFNGRSEAAGLATPDGKIKTVPYGTDGKNYGIGFETINF